jgi:CcmD family protein
MPSFAAAYLIVLFAVVLYVARLGVAQRRLARELEALRVREEGSRNGEEPVSRAA